MEKIGLIAGNGRFPIIFAQAAKREGYKVIAIAHKGETLEELKNWVDNIQWIRIGKLGKLIDFFKKNGVKDVALVGGITKKKMFTDIVPDLRALSLALRLKIKKPARYLPARASQWQVGSALAGGDDVILKAVAKELKKEGLIVQPSTSFVPSLLAPKGCLTGYKPNKEQQCDIEFGWQMAKAIGALDIGQCVVVKQQTVLAVEAIDGTDETIKRGGALAKGAVVVKVSKPQQDLRFDVPAVGLNTIKNMIEVKASVLAIETGKTLMFDKENMIEEANKSGISIVSL